MSFFLGDYFGEGGQVGCGSVEGRFGDLGA